MAVFKLGAFITDIVGSIGGTTFKRAPGSKIIMNKNFGTSSNKLLQNQQLNPIRIIFQSWRNLAPETKTLWNESALLFQFPDKFGDLKNLTGRQLFTKLNIQLIPVNMSITNPTGITNEISDFTILNGTVKTNQTEATITLNTVTGVSNYMIQAEVRQGEILSPSFTRRKVFFASSASGTETLDLTDYFFPEFPFFGVGYTVVYYVTAINNYGFKSATLFSYADVDPD